MNEQDSGRSLRGPYLAVTASPPTGLGVRPPGRRAAWAPAPGEHVSELGRGQLEQEEWGRGWRTGLVSVNGPRGPREQEVAPAKTLTEKLLSKQRWPGRWTPSTIVRGADPEPQALDGLLPAPRPFRREVIFSMGSEASLGVTRSLAALRVTLQNPLGLTPGSPTGAGPLPGARGAGTGSLNSPPGSGPCSTSILSPVLFHLL